MAPCPCSASRGPESGPQRALWGAHSPVTIATGYLMASYGLLGHLHEGAHEHIQTDAKRK